jgi:hypothetical protein
VAPLGWLCSPAQCRDPAGIMSPNVTELLTQVAEIQRNLSTIIGLLVSPKHLQRTRLVRLRQCFESIAWAAHSTGEIIAKMGNQS